MYVAQIQEADNKLRDRCLASAKTLYGENPPGNCKSKIGQRGELLAISQCNHATHYLIVAAMAGLFIEQRLSYHNTRNNQSSMQRGKYHKLYPPFLGDIIACKNTEEKTGGSAEYGSPLM